VLHGAAGGFTATGAVGQLTWVSRVGHGVGAGARVPMADAGAGARAGCGTRDGIRTRERRRCRSRVRTLGVLEPQTFRFDLLCFACSLYPVAETQTLRSFTCTSQPEIVPNTISIQYLDRRLKPATNSVEQKLLLI
jgi:hypothetical protein